jgi:hypothetical protein
MTIPIPSNLPGFAATQLGLADPGRCAVKRLTLQPDGSITSSDYDNGYEWWFRLFDAGSDFDRMAHELRRMARLDRVILCMGSPKPGLDLSTPHRRLWARSDPRENTMITVPRAWIAIDVDDAPVPAGLGAPGRYVEGAIYVRDAFLPEEFRGATMIVSPSARTGLRGPALLRARLWFLIDRPHELPVLKRWTRGLKAVVGVGDSAIDQAAQPIYTGRARFVGMADQIPPQLWAVVVRGSKDRVGLVADRYEPKVVEIERKMVATLAVARIESGIGVPSSASGGDWRGFLETTLGDDLGFFEPLTKGIGIAARSGDPDAEIVASTLALLSRRADPSRIAQYDAAWIARSLERFRAMDGRTRARRDAALSSLFGKEA